MEIPKFKPCPFCGSGENQIQILSQEYGFMVQCMFCHVKKDIFSNHISSCFSSWNYRDGKIDLTLPDDEKCYNTIINNGIIYKNSQLAGLVSVKIKGSIK